MLVSHHLQLIDVYLLFVLITGAVQFLYCLLVGTFPFNSFLSGFISAVGCFILACTRLFSCARGASLLTLPASLLEDASEPEESVAHPRGARICRFPLQPCLIPFGCVLLPRMKLCC
jgi:hypothetical protein